MTAATINDGQIWAANSALALTHPHKVALQMNGLRGSTNPAQMLAFSRKTYVGAQTWGSLAQMSDTAAQVLAVATAMGLSYVEMYVADCTAANDAEYAAWAASSPNLPGPASAPHRRVGLASRRVSAVTDRRASSEGGAGNRRVGAADRRAQPASRP